MAKKIEFSLPSVDDLFSTQEQRDDANREKVTIIPRSEIDSFPDHPFQVKVDESMLALVDSIKQNGVLVPATVRQKENGRYEYVAGHRRDKACELAGHDSIPCIIRKMSRDEAIINMVDSNLQRENILPSEKAKSYKMKYEAMKRQQGERTDLTSATVLQKSVNKSSREILAENSNDSHEQIRKFIRLTELVPQILNMVDEGKIAMRPAVEMSYLTQEQQELLLDEMIAEDRTPSHVQAMKMRKFADEGKLTEDVIHTIMKEEKPNQIEQFKISREKLSKFFPTGTSAQKIEETIIKALEMLRNRERSRAEAR